MPKPALRALPVSLLPLLILAPASADELEVPGDHATIQAALDAAQDGDVVNVGPGVWLEQLDFLGKDVHVRSTAGPAQTVLDGAGVGPVVRFVSGEGRGAVLEGFTVQNGVLTGTQDFGAGVRIDQSSPTIRGNVIRDNDAAGFVAGGGGIGARGGAPLILQNEIHDNSADFDYGGGVRLFQGSTGVVRANHVHHNANTGVTVEDSSATVEGNLIEENAGSGGVFVRFSSAVVRNNHVRGNTTNSGGGGISIGGAAAAQILDNVIEENTTTSFWGGGIECFAAGTPLIRGNVLRDNSAPEGGGIGMVNFSDAVIEQNLFVGNTATEGGAISFLVPASAQGPVVRRNTFVDNLATRGSALYAEGYDGGAEFDHNVVVAGAGQTGIWCDTGFNPDLPQFTYNDVWVPNGAAWGGDCPDLTGVDGNLSAEPGFVDAARGDYRLRTASPCVDAGDMALLPEGLDLGGAPRVVDGDLNGTLVLDLGAYEASHVALRILTPAGPGETLTVRADGSVGAFALIALGPLADGAIVPPFGATYVTIGAETEVLAAGGLPLRATWDIPARTSGSFALQAFVRTREGAGNASNPLFLAFP